MYQHSPGSPQSYYPSAYPTVVIKGFQFAFPQHNPHGRDTTPPCVTYQRGVVVHTSGFPTGRSQNAKNCSQGDWRWNVEHARGQLV